MLKKRELTIRVNDQQVTFNVLEVIKSPDKVEYCHLVNAVELAVTVL